MIKGTINICLVMIMAMVAVNSRAEGIMPRPKSMKVLSGSFALSTGTRILAPARFANEKLQLEQMLKSEIGLAPGQKIGTGDGIIVLSFERRFEAQLGAEGYELNVSRDSIVISSAGSAGIFYGIQSLRQLIRKEGGKRFAVPCIQVIDRPRFERRMFMLDEGRYFKGIKVVKGILDELALLKMNTFHWHLTEDQGWRIEIKKYPLLTSVGGYRDSTENSGWGATVKTFKKERHGGFYTQEEIREIVGYARDRHIEIIPEIDMPGHSSAAIAAYPWLSAADGKIGIPGNWGVLPNAYNVADPRVMGFLKDVLSEVMDLFPSKVIHIGGDEVDYGSWKSSKLARDFILERRLSSPADLQLWFTNEMAGFLRSKGRTMMGWNDIMGEKLMDHFNSDGGDYKVSGKLDSGAIVHFWLGDEKLIKKALAGGHRVVNAFHEFTYFNYPYDKISLEKAYGFDPVPAGVCDREAKLVIGASCQLWSEYVPDEKTLCYQLYPRLAAIAEVGWTMKENRDFDTFVGSLSFFNDRWKRLGHLWQQPVGKQ